MNQTVCRTCARRRVGRGAATVYLRGGGAISVHAGPWLTSPASPPPPGTAARASGRRSLSARPPPLGRGCGTWRWLLADATRRAQVGPRAGAGCGRYRWLAAATARRTHEHRPQPTDHVCGRRPRAVRPAVAASAARAQVLPVPPRAPLSGGGHRCRTTGTARSPRPAVRGGGSRRHTTSAEALTVAHGVARRRPAAVTEQVRRPRPLMVVLSGGRRRQQACTAAAAARYAARGRLPPNGNTCGGGHRARCGTAVAAPPQGNECGGPHRTWCGTAAATPPKRNKYGGR